MGKVKSDDDLDYGIVKINQEDGNFRIGYFDGFDDGAVIYFGIPIILPYFHVIFGVDLSKPTISEILDRRSKIHSALRKSPNTLREYQERSELLDELLLINGFLTGSIYLADSEFVKMQRSDNPWIFLSHSSSDKKFVRKLCLDLQDFGYNTWLDEWNIDVGESIISSISSGIQKSVAIILVLSNNSVSSRWVETEWQTKYWEEIQSGNIRVFPILVEDCDVPNLLKGKKYADFRQSYESGFANLIRALNKLAGNQEKNT